MFYKNLILASAAIAMAACSGPTDTIRDAAKDAKASAEAMANDAKTSAEAMASEAKTSAETMAGGAKSAVMDTANKAKLTAILAMQDDKAKARYQFRNPSETLSFFGITPGMKVAEALPGGGWYSKILIPYLGDEGHLTGVDYSLKMWPEFSFMTPERIEDKKTWPATWTEGAQDWRGGSKAVIDAHTFGARDTAQDGTYDAVLFIRALHNLSRFEANGGYMSEAIADTHAMLKPGGIVGVVQHSGPESNSDEWATGSNGYLKQSAVIAAFESAGFELVAESDINANPKDIPSNTDGVWRILPSLRGHDDDPEMKAKMEAIGESNRMTLKFKKSS